MKLIKWYNISKNINWDPWSLLFKDANYSRKFCHLFQNPFCLIVQELSSCVFSFFMHVPVDKLILVWRKVNDHSWIFDPPYEWPVAIWPIHTANRMLYYLFTVLLTISIKQPGLNMPNTCLKTTQRETKNNTGHTNYYFKPTIIWLTW